MGGREKSVPTEVGTHSVFLMEAVMARPVTAKLANFADTRLRVDDEEILADDIFNFGVFLHALFTTNYTGDSSPQQLRQLSSEELTRDVTFAALGPLLYSIFQGENTYAGDIAAWFSEVHWRSDQGSGVEQRDNSSQLAESFCL